ncbi:MAG: LCP family protein [Bacillus sp. (in: Bacteria)]|nr:LCP family protein [Bacillus sp. (in: firmicutes)]
MSHFFKKLSIKKILLLLFLLLILGGLITVAWAQNDYQKARQESLREIEERGGTVQRDEEIEFNAPEEELDYINVLLVGLDDDEDIARTDTIMIGQYRPDEGKVKLLSLMRDMYVEIPGYRNNKINASFAFGGLELLRKTIKENFDIEVHYYAQVNFDSFERIVDTLAPEGIDVEVERRMYYQSGSLTIDFQPGIQTMDGKEALKYARFRNDHENDFGRVRRQQQLLSVLKDEMLSLSGVRRIPQLLGSIDPYIQTNISTQKMMSYSRDLFLSSVDEIETLTIPVDGGFTDETYSHAGAVLVLDWEKNREALHEFLSVPEEDDS